jgi:hypothetical protein
MPAGIDSRTLYIGSQGPISSMNIATLYKPGELGARMFTPQGLGYQVVLCDSGPASVAAGDVAFWMNKSQYRVTNKLVDVSLGRNGVAGTFVAVVTPGNYCAIQISGRGKVKCPLNNMGQGDQFIANSGAASDAIVTANGTAPTQVILGFAPAAEAAVAGLAAIDLTIGDAAPQT